MILCLGTRQASSQDTKSLTRARFLLFPSNRDGTSISFKKLRFNSSAWLKKIKWIFRNKYVHTRKIFGIVMENGIIMRTMTTNKERAPAGTCVAMCSCFPARVLLREATAINPGRGQKARTCLLDVSNTCRCM